MTLVKICGITNIEDALACVELGADMLGFIFADCSPRRVDVETAAGIVEAVRTSPRASTEISMLGFTSATAQPPHPNPLPQERGSCSPAPIPHPLFVGVFTEQSDDIPSIAQECDLSLIQLHGSQSDEFAKSIGEERVIRVSRVRDEFSIDYLAEYPSAAYYMLDTYKKGMAGGTGETFDWSLAVLARSLLKKPIILSGGLNPGNVFDAVRAVRPYGVDVSSGVEISPGRKDIAKVKEFIDHVREADGAA